MSWERAPPEAAMLATECLRSCKRTSVSRASLRTRSHTFLSSTK